MTLFEKVINFIILQHDYHRRIIRQAGGENCLLPFHMPAVMKRPSYIHISVFSAVYYIAHGH
jgi:hypothetical protein